MFRNLLYYYRRIRFFNSKLTEAVRYDAFFTYFHSYLNPPLVIYYGSYTIGVRIWGLTMQGYKNQGCWKHRYRYQPFYVNGYRYHFNRYRYHFASVHGYRYPLSVPVPMCGFCLKMADFAISHPHNSNNFI